MLSVASFPSTNNSLFISTLNFKSRNLPSAIRCHAAAPSKVSLYEVLGVRRNASPSEIKTAYRILAKRYHPDAYSAALEENSRRRSFAEINEAYETLSDADARAVYDSSVTESGSGLSSSSSVTGFRINPTRKWETDQCW